MDVLSIYLYALLTTALVIIFLPVSFFLKEYITYKYIRHQINKADFDFSDDFPLVSPENYQDEVDMASLEVAFEIDAEEEKRKIEE